MGIFFSIVVNNILQGGDRMRKDLQEHINQYGVTRTHIAKQINVSRSMLTLYLQNQRNLSEENEFKLKKYLGQFEQIKLT